MRLFLFITFIVAGANGSPEPKPTPKPFWGGMLPPLGRMSPFPSFGGYGQYNPSGEFLAYSIFRETADFNHYNKVKQYKWSMLAYVSQT